MNIRVSQEDFNLRLNAEHSVGVRKGDIIALYPQIMHLDPEIYEDPEVCEPTSHPQHLHSNLDHQTFQIP